MSYLRITSPTFFPDGINALAARGWSKADELTIQSGSVDNKYLLCDGQPWDVATFSVNGTSDAIIIEVDRYGYEYFPVNFAAMLHSNFSTANGAGMTIRYSSNPITTSTSGTYLAGQAIHIYPDPDYINWTNGTAATSRYVALILTPSGTWSKDVTIGQVLMGQYYQMPHAGDLDVRTGFLAEGVSVLESDAGRRYGRADWLTGADSDGYQPFRNQTPGAHIPGRQYVEIGFSYIDDNDLVPADLVTAGSGSTFAERVFGQAGGELLPLIFSAGGLSTDASDYMWGRLVGDPMTLEQIGWRVYRMKIRLEQEV